MLSSSSNMAILSDRVNYLLLALSIIIFGIAVVLLIDASLFRLPLVSVHNYFWLAALIVLISALQIVAAVLVLRALPLAQYRIPIILIALALVFSIFPNLVELRNMLFHNDAPTFEEEFIELLHGALLVFGFILLRLVFYSIRASTEKIQAGERKYRTIFETVTSPLLLVDASTKKILDVNNAAVELYGYSRAELLSLSILQLAEEPEKIEYLFTAHVKKSPVHKHQRKNGSLFSARIFIDTVVIENKNIFCCAVNDLTEQLKQEEETLYHSYVLKSVNDAVVATDLDLNVTHWNSVAEELYGIRADDILGKPFGNFIVNNISPKEKRLLNSALMKGERWKQEFTQTLPDGKTIWVMATSSLLRDSNRKPIGFVTVYKDITERKIAELKLQESEAILKESQKIAKLGSFALDLRTGSWRGSEMLDTILGIDSSFPRVAEQWHQCIHPAWQSHTLDYFYSDVLKNNKPLNIQTKIIRKSDGEHRWVHAIGHFEYDKDAVPVKLVGTIQDITQQKQIEEVLAESERRFRAVLENVTLIAVILDSDGQITFCNDFLLKLTGWKREEILGKNWFDIFIPANQQDNVRKLFTATMHQHEIEHHHENPILCKDGSLRTISWSNILLENENGEAIGVTSIGEDITERKKAETSLRILTEELEEKVRSRTSELEESNRQLEAFSYSISHDLRAPIRAIDSFSKIVLEEEEKVLSSEGKRNLAIIRKNTQRMGRMVDDLLQFSRTARAELKKVQFDMPPMICKLLEEAVKLEPQRKFNTECLSMPKAYGDPSLLRQVWMNLIGNAVKFTRNCSIAHISVGGREEEDNMLYWITDNGAGFDMKYADKLFGVFQRLHTQQEFEGSGVGLAIVHRILQRHNGTIWARGEVGKGATFTFSLPKE